MYICYTSAFLRYNKEVAGLELAKQKNGMGNQRVIKDQVIEGCRRLLALALGKKRKLHGVLCKMWYHATLLGFYQHT
jgi:hypothetical protein